MDLAPFGFQKRRNVAVIVGAGATRGASFVHSSTICPPPLDTDFFRVLRASGLGARDSDAQKLLDFLDREFGSLDVPMETFYSQAFLHDQFVGDIRSGERGRLRRFEQSLLNFRRVLPRVFRESLPNTPCDYHASLVTSLAANDVLISFNYDCLLDDALRDSSGNRWRPGRGYGFDISAGLDAWTPPVRPGRPPTTGIRLLKPHGSLNWTRNGSSIELVEYPYHDREEGALEIVPPLWQKKFSDHPYTEIWTAARQVIRRVAALFVVGYSLPETDVYTQALLRLDTGELDFLCIVNPDQAARDRVKAVLRSSVTSSTHLVELDYLKDLHAVLSANTASPAPLLDS